MAKFAKKRGGQIQQVNTSALPDIIFMLLFFFMVSTTMKEDEVLVTQKEVQATEIQKVERKDLVSYIYIGKPMNSALQAAYGSETRIQLNGKIADLEEIQSFIIGVRESMKESDRPKMTVNLKIDAETKMGVVSDVKQALRKAQALRIMYAAADRQEVY